MTGITGPMLSGPFAARYDGDGLRGSKAAGGVTTYFLNDAQGQPVVEETWNGTAASVSASSGWGADGLRARYQPADSFAYDFSYDPQGDVVQRQTRGSFSSGSWAYDVAAYEGYGGLRADYGAFNGGQPGHLPAHRDQSGFGGQFGYYTDQETGLLCLTHRYYDPGTGRFINRDPAGYGGGVNLYGFAGDNPINEIDPDGTTYKQYLQGIGDSLNPINLAKGVVALGKYAVSGHFSGRALGRAFVQSINPTDPYINDREMGRRAANLVGVVVGAAKSVGAVGRGLASVEGIGSMVGRSARMQRGFAMVGLPGGLRNASSGLVELFSQGSIRCILNLLVLHLDNPTGLNTSSRT